MDLPPRCIFLTTCLPWVSCTNEKTSPQIACLPLPKKSREDMISFPPDDGDIVTARRIRAAPLVFTARQKPIIPLPRCGGSAEMHPALK